MGACGSTADADDSQNAALDRELRRQQQSEMNKLKFLLLGAGESGKSTLFKQMKILFSEAHGFTRAELEKGVRVVYNNVISNMKVLVAACETHTPAEDQDLADEILSLDEDKDEITPEVAEKLKAIWTDPGVEDTWRQRSDIQVQDSLRWYMEEIDRIGADDYMPSNQDLLRSRVRTSGIVEAEFRIGDVVIAMFDVGGQRNERKKWIHCFDNVTAVIFVAAISEYDQVLFEDQSTNRQDEAIALFQEMCQSKWFRDKSMLLFLNKRDLFREKLQYIPFKVEDGPDQRNLDYMGPENEPGTASATEGTPEFEEVYQATTRYLVAKYKEAGNTDTPGRINTNREIYVKITAATDTDQVATVMNTAKDIVLRDNLRSNGFY
ncbi:Guanine nucleotide-binding protein subunit alpha [Hondaea fermentalgiana]|uniref:Guanine nucleotide-binding protein subunit alpha n=1 Tax=Hondaea fermentalgiana TaxID=2315210 RepID=A0A2R5GZR7_9STRA|nr:Guanine nucleotide-binding protein subunit alpha [Hondaea fermentalgiana]|eukprot:GBG33544.1 Guanine nucleotide-binding protein subunit alpha [Hondaea fermentalgiana]